MASSNSPLSIANESPHFGLDLAKIQQRFDRYQSTFDRIYLQSISSE